MVAACLTNRSLRIALAMSFSLASCAKPLTTTVSVRVNEAFSGNFRLTPCIPGAQEPIRLNETAEGNTSACPSGDVEIAVIKPSKTFRIAPENVHVRRRPDGAPVAIYAQIP
jgi:hypothetical protein